MLLNKFIIFEELIEKARYVLCDDILDDDILDDVSYLIKYRTSPPHDKIMNLYYDEHFNCLVVSEYCILTKETTIYFNGESTRFICECPIHDIWWGAHKEEIHERLPDILYKQHFTPIIQSDRCVGPRIISRVLVENFYQYVRDYTFKQYNQNYDLGFRFAGGE